MVLSFPFISVAVAAALIMATPANALKTIILKSHLPIIFTLCCGYTTYLGVIGQGLQKKLDSYENFLYIILMTNKIDEMIQDFAKLAHGIYSTRTNRAMYIKELQDAGTWDAADAEVMHEMRTSMFYVRQCQREQPEDIYQAFKVIGTDALHEIVLPIAGSFCIQKDRNFLMACLKVAHPDKTWTELETLYHEKGYSIDNPNLVLSDGLASNFEPFFNPESFSIEALPEMDSHFTIFLFGVSAHKASQRAGSDKIFVPLFNKVINSFEQNQTFILDDEIYFSGLLRTALMTLPLNDKIFELRKSGEATVIDHLDSSIKHFKRNADFYETERFAQHHPDKAETWRNTLLVLEKVKDDIEKTSDKHAMFLRPFNTAIEVFSAREMFRLEKIIKPTYSELKQDNLALNQPAQKLSDPHI